MNGRDGSAISSSAANQDVNRETDGRDDSMDVVEAEEQMQASPNVEEF